MVWPILINYGAISFSLAWLISLIITIIFDKNKSNITNKNYRVLKRGLSAFGIAMALIIVAVGALMLIPNYILFIIESVLFLFSIIILYTNKKLGA